MVAKSAYWVAFDGVLVDDPVVGHPFVPTDTLGDVEAHPHVSRVVNQLEQVAVAGDDVDRLAGPRRQRADDVVGLVSGGADDADTECSQHLAHDRHLGLERVGNLLDVRSADDLLDHAVGLVGGQQVDAPLGPPVVVQQQTRCVGRYSSTSREM